MHYGSGHLGIREQACGHDDSNEGVIMGEVVELNMLTRLDIPPERVLKSAISAGLTSVLILGYTEDGGEYFASSTADGAEAVWLMERAKMRLLSVTPDDL